MTIRRFERLIDRSPFCAVSFRTVAIRAQLCGAVFGFLALVHSLQASIYADSVERYYFSFAVAYALAVTLYALSRPRLARTAAFIPWASPPLVSTAIRFVAMLACLLQR